MCTSVIEAKPLEIGGYFGLEEFSGPILHGEGIALNTGRSCLALLMKERRIRKIALPSYICDSVIDTAARYAQTRFYEVNREFKPVDVELDDDEWLYVVNFYGQLTRGQLEDICEDHLRVIVDNAQAYFDDPLLGVDTIYTCRKFFGVPDGAFLTSNIVVDGELPVGQSAHRMGHVLGRFEQTASEYYQLYVANNRALGDEPIMRMSQISRNLLSAIDYTSVREKRTRNYAVLHERLGQANELAPRLVEGAFAYPFMVRDGSSLRKNLQRKGVFVPTLWPNVIDQVDENSLSLSFARDLLPLPCDQRYDEDVMHCVADLVLERL